MNKKILIGSIIAVTILIGVSFTSVVGYNSVDSSVKASPLFNIRTRRAIEEESGDLSCEYVGKGEEINILIPERNPYGNLINRALNCLKEMDKDTINRYLNDFLNNGDIWMDKFKNIEYLNNSQLRKNNLSELSTLGENDPCLYPSLIFLLADFCLLEVILKILIAPFTIPLFIAMGSTLLVVFIILLLIIAGSVGLFILNSVFNQDCPNLTYPGPFSCSCEP